MLGGYVAAGVFAFAALYAYVAMTSGPERDQSQGMYAFGDSLVFLAVFALAGVPATGGALLTLRPYRRFWIALSATGVGIAVTCVAAFAAYFTSQTAPPGSALHDGSALAVLRMLAAPFFALAFLLSAIFAPRRPDRLALLGATAVEAVLFAAIVLYWIAGN